jgi:hypothetical protein
MNSSKLLPLLLCAAVACSAGCARVQKEKKTTGLEAATNAYGKSIRWAYYETAFGYIHPDQRKGQGLPEGLENVRVTGYEVVQPSVIRDENQTSAEQTVQIEYVLRDEQVVRRVSDRQIWRYDEETRTWWLHSDMPDFR